MSSQIYDRGYKNLSEGGYYYDGNWYSTEQAFNEAGYYEAKDAIVYLGTTSIKVRLQSIYYLLGDEYYTFNELHKLGYSLTRSIVKYFVNTLDNTYYSGYYNNSDGYFVNDGLGLWYSTIQELNTAGYDVGESHEYIYRISQLKRYDAISKTVANEKLFYVCSDSYNSWISDSNLSQNDLSHLPSVELDWTMGSYYSGGIGHGGHGDYSYNYSYQLRNDSTVSLSDMDNIFGYVESNKEYNCCGAYIGSYKKYLIGEKIWFEAYSRQVVMSSIYLSYSSGGAADSSYSSYQRIAICFERDVNVIKIYDNCNIAYSAFEYEYNSTKYYYICDGSLRQWVSEDNLSSVGFSLYKNNSIRLMQSTFKTSSPVIPEGYSIYSVKTYCAYSFPSYLDVSSGTVAFDGKDIYSTTVSPSQIRVNYNNYSKPSFAIQQGVSTSSQGSFTDYKNYSAYSGYSSCFESYDAKYVNGTDQVAGDYFIYLKGENPYISSSESGLPAYITYDEQNINTFNIPSSLYSVSGTSINWLGDATDTSDLSYYYYNKPVNIYLYAQNQSDRIVKVDFVDIVTGEIHQIEYWPHSGYLYNSAFYTEQQLNSIGYWIANYTKTHTLTLNDTSQLYITQPTKSTRWGFVLDGLTRDVYSKDSLSQFVYTGELAIKVEFSREEIDNHTYSLSSLPDEFVSDEPSATFLKMLLSYGGTPREPLRSCDIGKTMKLLITSNCSSSFYYHYSMSPITVKIDERKRPTFTELLATENSTGNEILVYYNSSIGYLIRGVGTYSTEEDLNLAGYSLVNNVQVKRLFFSNSSMYIEGYITSLSTAFNVSSYSRGIYEDPELAVPYTYTSGTSVRYFIDDTLKEFNSKYKVTSLSDFPDSTVSYSEDRTDGFFIMTTNGTPINQYVQSDSGSQMVFYMCTSYAGTISNSIVLNCYVIISSF